MPKWPEEVLCGFTDILLFKEYNLCTTRRSIEWYNDEMSDLELMKYPAEKYHQRISRYKNYLKERSNFKGYSDGQRRYFSRFTYEMWKDLSATDKTKHIAINCRQCPQLEEYGLKACNVGHINYQKSIQPPQTPIIIQIVNEKTPNISNKIPSRVLRKLKTQFLKTVRKQQVNMHTLALLSSKVSIRGYRKLRMRQNTTMIRNRPKCHVGRLDKYHFDKEVIQQRLQEVGGGVKELGRRMEGKWEQLARDAGVRRRGTLKTTLNKAQIVQAYAKSLGYSFNQRRQMRPTFVKVDGVALKTSPSPEELVKERDRMIEAGDINIGRAICPFSAVAFTSKGETSITIKGRVIPLDVIRTQHLQRMDELGLLRNSKTESLSYEECEALLRRRGVSLEEDDSLREIRDRVEVSETTRHIKIWHDHSTLNGHSTFLITVAFMYNTSVYLTEEESKMCDVQSLVERPYLHMIGRSRASADDMLQYTGERVKELQTTREPIFLNGRLYKDKPRVFSGDLPGRSFEMGQTGPSSHYSCWCGLHRKNFCSVSKMLDTPTFLSIADRVAHFNPTKPPHFNYTVTTNTTKAELVAELDCRGLRNAVGDQPTKKHVQNLLKAEMKGLIRLPALLTNGQTPAEIGCDELEVCACEPLHDLKNLICNIIVELPAQIRNHNLKKDIEIYCNKLLNQKEIVRGCDMRLGLINLTQYLQNVRFQTDSQCYEVYKMLFLLCDLQRQAYMLEKDRCPREVLRMGLNALLFGVSFSNIFKTPKILTNEKTFGTPYHCVVSHMPVTLRIMSLRTVATEAEERMFNELRQYGDSSNRQNDNLLLNMLVRQQARQQVEEKEAKKLSFVATQNKINRSMISLAAEHLKTSVSARRTILTKDFMDKNKLATIRTLKRLGDFIKNGPASWYEVMDDGSLIFNDGGDDDDTRHKKMTHFSNTSIPQVYKAMERNWHWIRENTEILGISVLSELFGDGEDLAESDQDDSDHSDHYDSETDNEDMGNTPSGDEPHSKSDDCVPVTISKKSEGKDSYEWTDDEIWIINLWKSEKSETSTIKDFLMKRKQFERNKTSIIGQSSFARALLHVRPELKGIRESCREALTKLERDHYKNHKTLSSSSLNPRLDKNIHILTLFTATPH